MQAVLCFFFLSKVEGGGAIVSGTISDLSPLYIVGSGLHCLRQFFAY